jgi:broad specificity phosphatase PhoE
MMLVRHGNHDSEGRFLQHACTGLTDLGRQQAELLAARLRDGECIDAIITSKAARAIQTGRVIADALGLELSQTCDLCEMHPGAAEGLTTEEMNERFGPNYRSVPGAEYWPDWLPGAVGRLQDLAGRYRGRTVLAVTHNAMVKASLTAYGAMPPSAAEAVNVDNTALTVWSQPVDPKDRRSRVWALERHNDTAHCYRASTRRP